MGNPAVKLLFLIIFGVGAFFVVTFFMHEGRGEVMASRTFGGAVIEGSTSAGVAWEFAANETMKALVRNSVGREKVLGQAGVKDGKLRMVWFSFATPKPDPKNPNKATLTGTVTLRYDSGRESAPWGALAVVVPVKSTVVKQNDRWKIEAFDIEWAKAKAG